VQFTIDITGGPGMGNPLAAIYKRLPEGQRKLVNTYLAFPKQIVRYGLELRFKVYEDLDEKKFVYITSDEPDTGFIEYFFPGSTVTRVNTIYAWNLKRFSRRYDKVIIDMHSHLAPFFTDGHISARWIRQGIDLTTQAEELFKIKWILREKKKAEKFQPLFSADPADLDFFYDKMYVAYLQKRFDDAIIVKKVFFQNYLGECGELLFLKKDDQIVAGALFDHVGNSYILLTLGVTDEKYVKEGATTALYYYGIKRAQEKGATYFDYGLSRPFVSDGVLKYKSRWGGRIERNHESSHLMYLKNIVKEGLIILEDEKFKVLVPADNEGYMALAAEAGLEIKKVEPTLPVKFSSLFSLFGIFWVIRELTEWSGLYTAGLINDVAEITLLGGTFF
jgi:hypothetical protein